jgi:hypothetical protein
MERLLILLVNAARTAFYVLAEWIARECVVKAFDGT